MKAPKPLTAAQAAELLGVLPDSVRQAINQGRLSATKYGEGTHGLWLIHPKEVERYANERKRKR